MTRESKINVFTAAFFAAAFLFFGCFAPETITHIEADEDEDDFSDKAQEELIYDELWDEDDPQFELDFTFERLEYEDPLNICGGILTDEVTAPYPSYYYEEPARKSEFQNELARFFADYGVEASEAEADGFGAAFTLRLSALYRNAPIVSIDGDASLNDYYDFMKNLMGKYPALFAAAPYSLGEVFFNHKGGELEFVYNQDYCGRLFAPETSAKTYRAEFGFLIFVFDETTTALKSVVSRLVPMKPLPYWPVISRTQAANAFASAEYVINCADGEKKFKPSSLDAVSIIGDPIVYAAETKTEPLRIEYRLAYFAEIRGASGLEWTAYVDAVDGSFLMQKANAGCD